MTGVGRGHAPGDPGDQVLDNPCTYTYTEDSGTV
jgi:hypothetical protein